MLGEKEREIERTLLSPSSAFAKCLCNSSLLRQRDASKSWSLFHIVYQWHQGSQEPLRKLGITRVMGYVYSFYSYHPITWLCPVMKHCLWHWYNCKSQKRCPKKALGQSLSLSLVIRLLCGHLLWISRPYFFQVLQLVLMEQCAPVSKEKLYPHNSQ